MDNGNAPKALLTSDPAAAAQLQAQMRIVALIRQELSLRQAKREGYSLRSFALALKVAPAALSEILSGKRKITRKMARKIFNVLAVDPATEQELTSAIPEKQVRRKRALRSLEGALQKSRVAASATEPPPPADSRVLKFIQLSTDEFRVIADWYHLAILSLAETASFQSDAGWIARRLGITKYEAKGAVDTLTRLGLLERDGSGNLKATGKQFTTTNDISDASIRKNHAQGLELARDALDRVPVELREFSASIIAADLELLPEAKKRLRELRREVTRILEGGPHSKKTEVYRLSVQLFPLSRS